MAQRSPGSDDYEGREPDEIRGRAGGRQSAAFARAGKNSANPRVESEYVEFEPDLGTPARGLTISRARSNREFVRGRNNRRERGEVGWKSGSTSRRYDRCE